MSAACQSHVTDAKLYWSNKTPSGGKRTCCGCSDLSAVWGALSLVAAGVAGSSFCFSVSTSIAEKSTYHSTVQTVCAVLSVSWTVNRTAEPSKLSGHAFKRLKWLTKPSSILTATTIFKFCLGDKEVCLVWFSSEHVSPCAYNPWTQNTNLRPIRRIIFNEACSMPLIKKLDRRINSSQLTGVSD